MPYAILKDQFDRARLSIPLNLAEGSGKPTRRDRRRFYAISLGSLRETTALLEIIGNRTLDSLSDVLAAHIYRLIQNAGGGG